MLLLKEPQEHLRLTTSELHLHLLNPFIESPEEIFAAERARNIQNLRADGQLDPSAEGKQPHHHGGTRGYRQHHAPAACTCAFERVSNTEGGLNICSIFPGVMVSPEHYLTSPSTKPWHRCHDKANANDVEMGLR